MQHRPIRFFIIQRWMEKTTGFSAMARLDNPVAHPSGAGGWRCVCCARSLVRVLGGRRGRWRLGAACFAGRCTVHGAGGGDSHGVGGEHVVAAGGPGGGDAAVEALAVIKINAYLIILNTVV